MMSNSWADTALLFKALDNSLLTVSRLATASVMEGDSPARLPVAQTTQAQAPPGQPVIYQQQVLPGQPIMYQMQTGQQQPVSVQVPAGQPATTTAGQPIQYYYVPVTQPMQPGQQGQPVQPVQPVYVQQVQPQRQAGQGLDLAIDTDFLKSPMCFIKIAEFVVLLGAWASILKYFDDLDPFNRIEVDNKKASFFKGITIFCWVMVILYLIIHTLSFPKICKFKRPSLFTLASLIFYFIMFTLLLTCTGNLVSRAVEFGNPFLTLSVALAFGFLSCIAFVVDMVLNHKLFRTQRAQEMPPDQGPPQRRAWDVNIEYIRSPLFYVKSTEISLLFAAWVCIIKYFDMTKLTAETPVDFFKGITIFSWVMVVLLALTFVLSFDKLCSRSSPWTLTTLLIHFVLSVLLIASCGNVTSHAIDYVQAYNDVFKPDVLALVIGLGFGYHSWIIFIVDIYFLYKLYKQQRAEEVGHPQQAGQPGVVQQPAVVFVPQGATQQVYQPLTHPRQQPVQYPGQQPVLMGMHTVSSFHK
ncbi:uncharacterized protein LOC110061637 isoform X2 [Orbicella faveolata]|uniref:uncharacterized protein LOC110061637 isoform X2 n=1 Tax=Orbicella faveolata TaxID=48498 RepID=UPI0009E41D79|nr:uncharacterized protein LOC110061637 isoform X2 [Orbicella faveolata]